MSAIMSAALHGLNTDLAPLEEEEGGGGEGEGDEDEDGEGDEEGDEGDGEGDEDGEDEGEGAEGEGTEGQKNGKSKKGSKEGDGEGEDGDKAGQKLGGKKSKATKSKSKKGGGFDASASNTLAQALLDAMAKGKEMVALDSSSALGGAVDAKKDEEEASCKHGEQIWRPASPDDDRVTFPNPSAASRSSAEKLRDEVRVPTSALRAQLRNRFLQARKPRELHGVRAGLGMSDRRMVDSYIEILSGVNPTRPDWKRRATQAVTLAAAVVIDESGSMNGEPQIAVSKAALVLADSLDANKSPCLVVGPRNYGYGNGSGGDAGTHQHHRHSPIIVDVFKNWHENMTSCWPRFGCITANGGTPLEDGIQYAMQELNDRRERFRVIFVLTDGCPDNPDVVRRQIRLAAESGVYVVGVGIGTCVSEVKRLFPLNIVVPNVENLPIELISLLTGIIFPKHGKAITLDGRVNNKVV